MSVSFGPACKTTGLVAFSPNNDFVATTREHVLVIRHAHSFEIFQRRPAHDQIDYLEFSADSMYVMVANFKRALVEVFSLEDPEWTCRIDEAATGLEAVRWSLDGRHVLTTSSFKLRITVWSLVSPHVTYIKFPKHDQPGFSLAPNGRLMAVLERRQGRDYCSIISTEAWKLACQFTTETSDAQDVVWSPDSGTLAIYESNLYYKINFFDVQGQLLGTYSAYEDALGIKGVSWSPSSQLIAVGSYDERVRLLNNINWKRVTEFEHETRLVASKKWTLFQEEAVEGDTQARHFVVVPEHLKLVRLTHNPEKPNPRMGIAWSRFSCESRYLATRNDATATCLFIWDVSKLRMLAAVNHEHPLRDGSWHPTRPLLAACSGSPYITFWTPDGITCVRTPSSDEMKVSHLQWSKDGTMLLLSDKKRAMACFPLDAFGF
ncbi:uncharacterized protein MONBRDRAFT_32721 [Monosiga brevicollis MX1]|uniref:Anaphase-promoting complex subunit 4 WD40 domain-containing protein n=1 Tax=Monosiga brevicollis TaxID=81824 RepID=A9V1A3_MONBE|nr:uncharacterized protein MONBRDRAFT_32721 [Monosiga brevicollis MX1]EDQ88773.1 predicted protein [Monosiga brevicollis MX1]|eukprot:XP_001746386.1 hypothetical protein [Monosiga brevicollis MX1]